MKSTIRVCVSGAAGQIAYALIPELVSGTVFGEDQPVHLVCLDVEVALESLTGLVMELEDSVYPTYIGCTITSDPLVAFKDVDYVILLGAFPRGQGMTRKDLLEKNKGIFEAQGKALQQVAKPETKVLVVGNPANTNACILAHYATNLNKYHITAMTRLDHNRSVGQLALKLGVSPSVIKNVFIFGNHSDTMVPVYCSATVDGKKAMDIVPHEWFVEIAPVIKTRGSKVIEARKKSSAASAARAALDHIHDWHLGTPSGEYVSVSLSSVKDNIYGVPEGIMFSCPCKSVNGEWVPVKVEYCSSLQADIDKSVKDLLDERQLALGF